MAQARTQDIAYAIYKATDGKSGAELKSVLDNVVRFLSNNKLLHKRNEILEKLENVINKEEGLIKVNIKSKSKVKKETLHEILEFLKHKYKAKEVHVDEEIDESLIAGVKIQIDDEIIDMTLRNRVDQLETYLLKN